MPSKEVVRAGLVGNEDWVAGKWEERVIRGRCVESVARGGEKMAMCGYGGARRRGDEGEAMSEQ